SFLTTSERRPPWMTIEGDGKTPDVGTVLRQSLQTSLATRIAGCEGVKDLMEAEAAALGADIDRFKKQLNEIVNGWINRAAFDQAEFGSMPTVEQVEQRFRILTDLVETLGKVNVLKKRLADLQAVASKFASVEALPELILAERTLESL